MSKRFVETVVKSDGVNWKTPNASLLHFAKKIYGQCPKCRQCTIIISEFEYFYRIEKSRVQCLTCSFYEDWDEEKLYGAAIGKGKKPCPNCGTKWLSAEVKIKDSKPLKDHAEVTCQECKKTSYVSLTWHQCKGGSAPRDPYFSYPLWLQIECVGKILWAYNDEHLVYLKNYIEADLRDDNERLKWSLISKLPKWMTSAKNRDSVLKAITKLEKTLPGKK